MDLSGCGVTVRPSGTVTFLFTDVEGSTKLWEVDSDAMSASLQVHDRILRGLIESFDGYVFTTAGDSFAAAFARASDAVAAAAKAQRELAGAAWGAGPALRVRMGMHLGEAEERAKRSPSWMPTGSPSTTEPRCAPSPTSNWAKSTRRTTT